jgi:hypothetical protein
MMPESQYATALYDVVLSPDGNTAYFTDEIFIGTDSVDNLSTIKALDISSCTSGCDAPTLASTVTGPLKTFMHLTINPAGTILYYTRHGFPTVIGMIEVSTGETRMVATEVDPLYFDEKFVELASGTGSSGEDLIAVQLDDIQNTIDIIDVTNCTADGSISSCIADADADATIYITGIPRGTFSFHGPDLLIARDGGIDLFYTDTLLSYIGLIEGVGVGNPDSAE